MEEVTASETELQMANARLAMIASFVLGLVVIVAAVTMWTRRSQQAKAEEAISIELESEDPEA